MRANVISLVSVDDKPQGFRVKPYLFYVGVANIVLMSLLGVGMLYFDDYSRAPSPLVATWIAAGISCFFVLLGLYLALHAKRYRLVIDEERAHQVGVLSEQSLPLSDINELRWRTFPAGGSICLITQRGTMKIDLGQLMAKDRDSVIAELRNLVPHDRQTHWEDFSNRFLDTPAYRKSSHRKRHILIGVFAAHAIAFVALGLGGRGNHLFLFGIVNALFAGYLVFRQNSR